MNVLRVMFPGRIISRFGDIHCPPRSPDLSIPDFFLWGYLKVNVYEHHPRSLRELKNAIRTEIEAIEPDLLGRVLENLVKRCQDCLNHNGGHLLDEIFKN